MRWLQDQLYQQVLERKAIFYSYKFFRTGTRRQLKKQRNYKKSKTRHRLNVFLTVHHELTIH